MQIKVLYNRIKNCFELTIVEICAILLYELIFVNSKNLTKFRLKFIRNKNIFLFNKTKKKREREKNDII